jgi:hypothetical protein
MHYYHIIMTLEEDYELYLVDIIFEYLFIDFPLHLSIHYSILFILHTGYSSRGSTY